MEYESKKSRERNTRRMKRWFKSLGEGYKLSYIGVDKRFGTHWSATWEGEGDAPFGEYLTYREVPQDGVWGWMNKFPAGFQFEEETYYEDGDALTIIQAIWRGKGEEPNVKVPTVLREYRHIL